MVTIDGQVTDLGKLSAHSHLTLRGDSELLFRILFRKTPKSEWKALGRYLAMIGGVGGDVTEIKPAEPSALEKPFEIDYDVSRDDFLDWSSKKLKPLAAQLKTATFNFVFPDAAPTKLVRRGALLCLPKPGFCSFFMVQPDLITSIE